MAKPFSTTRRASHSESNFQLLHDREIEQKIETEIKLEETGFCSNRVEWKEWSNLPRSSQKRYTSVSFAFQSIKLKIYHRMLQINDVLSAGKHAWNEIRIHHWMTRVPLHYLLEHEARFFRQILIVSSYCHG